MPCALPKDRILRGELYQRLRQGDRGGSCRTRLMSTPIRLSQLDMSRDNAIGDKPDGPALVLEK